MITIAIYHLEAKVISRNTGRSAVAAAAYMSCDQIYNDYDGINHDYTRKQGLVWEQVFLPENAPTEWKDRAVLWNEVEKSEKSKDSRLARELVVALPTELNKEQWKNLLSEFIKDSFVSDGMCADVAIHDTDSHNPHAHIMLTVRPLDEKGKWQNKTEKEYLCIRNGEEQGFTASEFKTAQTDGWEKQYQYKVGRKKVYLPPSEAQGYDRVSKYPKSTRYGRQNPVSERWNSDEQLVLWRKAWEEVSNKYLSLAGTEKTIDCRSNAERGIDEQPTVHEGVKLRILEKKGIISERCELNRQIMSDNSLLRKLKETVKKLIHSVRNTIPSIAEAMENEREKVVVFCYQLNFIHTGQKNCRDYLSSAKSAINKFNELMNKIKEVSKELRLLTDEKEHTLFLNISKHKKLDRRIEELNDILENLNAEKSELLEYLNCADDKEIYKIEQDIANTEANLKKLNTQEEKYSSKLNAALKEYSELHKQAAELDISELYNARQAIRPEKEHRAEINLKNAYGTKYNAAYMLKCRQEAAKLLNEESERRSVRETIRQRKREIEARQREQENEQRQTNVQQNIKKKNRGMRR